MIEEYQSIKHYEVYKKLSESHNWPVLPQNLLPIKGFVSYVLDKPACIVFVYDTVLTSWAVMEWLIADMSFTKEHRNQSITECINAAMGYADQNKLTLFTSCKGVKLKHRYQQAGFIKTDEGMTNFIYRGQ